MLGLHLRCDAMMKDADILAEYAAQKVTDIPGSAPFVFRLDYHMFIEMEVEVEGRAFLLKLAEALPGVGLNAKPVIALQTKDQLVRQVLGFINRLGDAA
jgi:hypothetical protein